jgi:hypothetical protein
METHANQYGSFRTGIERRAIGAPPGLLLEKGTTKMRGYWPLLAITAGTLLLSIAPGARADDRHFDHDRDARAHHHEFVRAEHRRDFVRAEEARDAERRRERIRAEEARRERERHWRAGRAHDRHNHDPFGYIRATDRERHRS